MNASTDSFFKLPHGFRFKKCKAVGMTYRDPENILPDSNGVVPIPKELFEARQRELQEISCQKKDKSKTKMTESSVRNSTKLELKSSLVMNMINILHLHERCSLVFNYRKLHI